MFVPITFTNTYEIRPLAWVVVNNTFGGGGYAYFSPDDRWLVIPAPRNGKALSLETYTQRFTPAYVRTFIPSTDWVSLASGGQQLKTFNYATGVQRVWNNGLFIGNTTPFVSPNGEYALTRGDIDNVDRLWRVSRGTQVRILVLLVLFKDNTQDVCWKRATYHCICIDN